MALVLADRVQETSTTSGTGTFTLNGAVSGYQSFATGIGSGNTVYYAIYDATAFAWEVGLGTYTSGSPNTLTRTTVYSNSLGTTAKISFAGNTSSVFATYPGSTAVSTDTLAYPPAIGGTTPAAGTFAGLIGGKDKANYLQLTGSVAGAGASALANILFTGTDSSVNGVLSVKGNGYVAFSGGGGTNSQALRVNLNNAVSTGNLLQIQGVAAGSAPVISAISGTSGTDTNIDITLTPKGTGRVNVTTSIKPKVNSAAGGATTTLTWDSTSYDSYALTAITATTLTVNLDSSAGGPADGQKMVFRFTTSGVTCSVSFTSSGTYFFRPVGVTTPVSIASGKTAYVGCMYNAANASWDIIAVSIQA